jgi:hypothetical protein
LVTPNRSRDVWRLAGNTTATGKASGKKQTEM